METKYKVILSFVILVLIVAGLYIFTDWFSKVTGYLLGEEETVKLARCLDKKNSEFYDSINCVDCEKQRKLFGKAMKFITIVDCGENKELCKNIREVPAWYIDKNIYYGYKDINELKDISGCTD